MKITGWAALVGSAVVATDAVQAPPAVKVSIPLLGLAAERAGSELGRRDYGNVELIDPEREYPIMPGGCAGGSFVGAYRAQFPPVIVDTSVERR